MDSNRRVIKRVVKEMEKLDKKIVKLEVFIKSDRFKEISRVQRELLKKQKMYMIKYAGILVERLNDLKGIGGEDSYVNDTNGWNRGV